MTAPLDLTKPIMLPHDKRPWRVVYCDDLSVLVEGGVLNARAHHARQYIDEYAKNIPPEPPKPVGPDEVTVGVWPDGAMSLMHGHPPAVQVRYLRADLAEKLEARIRELHLEVCAVDEKRKVKPLNKCEIGAFRAAYSDASMMSRFRDAMAARGIEVGE